MSKWRIEVNETVNQETVYIVEADTQEKAEEIVRTEESDMEQLSYYVQERKLNTILSVEPFQDS